MRKEVEVGPNCPDNEYKDFIKISQSIEVDVQFSSWDCDDTVEQTVVKLCKRDSFEYLGSLLCPEEGENRDLVVFVKHQAGTNGTNEYETDLAFNFKKDDKLDCVLVVYAEGESVPEINCDSYADIFDRKALSLKEMSSSIGFIPDVYKGNILKKL